MVVVLSLFLVYSNVGVVGISGLLAQEFRETFGCGEATTTWMASLQFSVCLMAGRQLYVALVTGMQFSVASMVGRQLSMGLMVGRPFSVVLMKS